MKTVTDIASVTIEVKKSDLIEGEWVTFDCVSKKLKAMEENESSPYKSLRNRFYNSVAGNKYNTRMYYGFKCINVENTMQSKASLELNFKVVA